MKREPGGTLDHLDHGYVKGLYHSSGKFARIFFINESIDDVLRVHGLVEVLKRTNTILKQCTQSAMVKVDIGLVGT